MWVPPVERRRISQAPTDSTRTHSLPDEGGLFLPPLRNPDAADDEDSLYEGELAGRKEVAADLGWPCHDTSFRR